MSIEGFIALVTLVQHGLLLFVVWVLVCGVFVRILQQHVSRRIGR